MFPMLSSLYNTSALKYAAAGKNFGKKRWVISRTQLKKYVAAGMIMLPMLASLSNKNTLK